MRDALVLPVRPAPKDSPKPVTVRLAGTITAQGIPEETLPCGRVRLIEPQVTGWPVGSA